MEITNLRKLLVMERKYSSTILKMLETSLTTLASNLPGVVVLNRTKIVSRQAGAQLKHFGVDTVIPDDGFQYLHLKGQLNILLVDQTNPFGNRRLLPRGILREPVRTFEKRASYIFFTESEIEPDLRNPADYPEIQQSCRDYSLCPQTSNFRNK